MSIDPKDGMRIAVHGQNGMTDEIVSALADTELTPELPDDLREWINGAGPRAVVVPAGSLDELEAVIDLRDARWDLVVITLMPDATQASYRRALRAGATAAVASDAPIDEMVEVVREAVQGRAVLPADVARRLALDAPEMPSDYSPSFDEIGWVQAMAAGTTIADLAEQSGCSKSEMTRRLNMLYEQVGAENRTDALIKFARWGLLD